MARRPTITDLAAAAGVSVATVDRVLNRRLPVREDTVERVLAAAETIGYHGSSLIRQRLREEVPVRTFGFLLQRRTDAFYARLADDLAAATRAATFVRGRPVVVHLDDIAPEAVAAAMEDLGGRVDALGVVSVDHPKVGSAVSGLKARGVPTFALLSDLTAEDRAGYLGRDNRKEGRTAAWVIARTTRQPGKVGIIVGSHRFIGQEMAEISFRSWFREHAPAYRLLEPLVNLEDARIAYKATREMLEADGDLVGLYIAGGGYDGAIEAVRHSSLRGSLSVVCTELTPANRVALVDGVLTAVISTPTALLAQRTVEAMARALDHPSDEPPGQILVPFEFYVSENV